MYLTHKHIVKLLKKEKLIISPLLDDGQINEMTIDLRLGYDFLVSIQGRWAYLNSASPSPNQGAFNKFFQESRRKLGDTFLLHPNQTVLASTLEYIKLPDNLVAILNTRSSYNRLGINISNVFQPGYCGCLSVELTNSSNNPVQVRVGAAMFQIRFVPAAEKTNYFSKKRKYMCAVKPEISGANKDKDLDFLKYINENN